MARVVLASLLLVACFLTADAGEEGGRAAAAGAHHSPAAAGQPRERSAQARDDFLTEAEKTELSPLLDSLGAAIRSADAEAVEGLLSPSLPPAERARILSRVRGEFRRLSYGRFSFLLTGGITVDRLEGGRRIEFLVPASYEYEARAAGPGAVVSRGENSFRMQLERTEGEWRLLGSTLFEQFTALSWEHAVGWIFLGSFLGLLVVFFWVWMAIHCWIRTGRASYGMLLFLSTPIGATLYFLAVFLRSRRAPPEGA